MLEEIVGHMNDIHVSISLPIHLPKRAFLNFSTPFYITVALFFSSSSSIFISTTSSIFISQLMCILCFVSLGTCGAQRGKEDNQGELSPISVTTATTHRC